MFKLLAFGAFAAAALVVAFTPAQARDISVWGNNFTVDDGPAAVQGAPTGLRFGATVAHPERFMRRPQRLDDLN